MKAAGATPKKRLSLLLLSAGLLFGVSVGAVSARDYYDDHDNYGEEEPYESSDIFFYDYADEEGPSAPPEPVYSGNGASQLIIISPPEDAWQDPRIRVGPVRAHDHAPKEPAPITVMPHQPARTHNQPPQQEPAPITVQPARADNHPPQPKTRISPSDQPIAPARPQQPVTVQPVRADNHPPQETAPLSVREFVAEPTAGKPAVDPSGKTVHFYSDPAPLVMEPPPDPNFDPDFADFEKSRAIPVVNAPDGIYGFAFEGEGIQIAASHTYDGVQIRAGDIMAMNMLITNNSTLKRIFTESVSGPEGLKGVHEIAAFEINPGDTVTRRVSLHIGSSMAAGEHRASYRVTCRTSPRIGGELEFGFAIRALPRLAFEIASAAPLIENAPFKATGRIINTGNTGLNIQLSLKGRQKNLQVTPSRISLPAGGHAFVEIEGTAPARQHPLDDIFNFDLTAVSDKVSGSLQLLNEPVKLRIASKQ